MNYDKNDLGQEFQQYVEVLEFAKILKALDFEMQAEVTGAIRSVSAGLDLLKKAANLAEQTKNAELIELLANSRLEIAEAKIALAEAKEQGLKIEQENRQLKEALEGKNQPILRDGFYYKADNDGPFCTCCHDTKTQFVRVVVLTGRVPRIFQCPSCKTTYPYSNPNDNQKPPALGLPI